MTIHSQSGQIVCMPLMLNGHQLRDALSLIAPDETPEQLATVLCLQPGSARTTASGVEPAGVFCWLKDFPNEGSVRLDESPRPVVAQPPAIADTRAYGALVKIVEAARWVGSNTDLTKQPAVYRLIRAVLDLASPVIDAHVTAVCTPPEAEPTKKEYACR